MSETFSNKLTPAELERLAYLSEECSEVIHIINKIIRHGYGDETTQYNNRDLLCREFVDVEKALYLMYVMGDINPDDLDKYGDNIPQYRYMHHQDLEKIREANQNNM